MDLDSIFIEGGLLSQAVAGFTPRLSQKKMAEAVDAIIKTNGHLVVEAGTGTGKTFAYLIPAFLSGKKTIISTGSRALQEQLFFKDLPFVRQLLKSPLVVTLLKGRANYLCHYRLEQNILDGRFISREEIHQLSLVREWVSSTQSGDIAELTVVPEDASIWARVTSTIDNCLGQECPFVKNCFVVKARQSAMIADVVIVNHHLFFANMALQKDGFGELLPKNEVVIFDEAHQLPELISQFFSIKVSGRQLLELSRDINLEIATNAVDLVALPLLTQKLITIAHELRLALSPHIQRAPWPEIKSSALSQAIKQLHEILILIEGELKIAAVRTKGLENAWRRTLELIERYFLLFDDTPENMIHWFETHSQSFSVHLTPMLLAKEFIQFLAKKDQSIIFTSATLTANNRFDIFVQALGLKHAIQLQLDSPFDYQKQSILYVPRGLPDSRQPEYIAALVHAAIPVLELTNGRTFFLSTSHRALEEITRLLREKTHFHLLVQGSMPKKKLLEAFIHTPRAVLLGTGSFWQGVDVRGEALSCVIIDKLPFTAPDEPILQARLQQLRRQGEDPFYVYQLPQAVLLLKQGMGRLIRDAHDRGILLIGDSRLVGARYGNVFLRSLPVMPRTRNLEVVRDFWLK